MMLELSSENIAKLKNPQFRTYAQIYTRIYDQFMNEVSKQGLDFGPVDQNKLNETRRDLQAKGAILRNDDKSIYINWLSSACEACRKGEDSLTFYLSLKCHRKCYYCFNPNQESYEYYSQNHRNCLAELDSVAKSGRKLAFIALTGGEPLIHKKETVEFFRHAKQLFPRAHTRLYTSGDLLDKDILARLQDAKLDEIRFSVKLEDKKELREKVLANMRLTKEYIRDVMVEMPVIPGTLDEMKELLRELDQIGIAGINLLEFCFPYNNVGEFKKRSFAIKVPPYKVLYDYWYAGGLPVAGSEQDCLALVDFALTEKLSLGVHYCSLENKHTGQVYQQNRHESKNKLLYFSPKDFFLKKAKVFGKDIPEVLKVFKKKMVTNYNINDKYNFLEFHVKDIKHLKKLPIEVGISYNIIERRDDEKYLRELKIDMVYPEDFDIKLI